MTDMLVFVWKRLIKKNNPLSSEIVRKPSVTHLAPFKGGTYGADLGNYVFIEPNWVYFPCSGGEIISLDASQTGWRSSLKSLQ